MIESGPGQAMQFTEWLPGALEAGVREPHAMTVSTVVADGNPTARTLILKGGAHPSPSYCVIPYSGTR
ncbi:hypothetical protein [Streptomyces sp. NPDC050528]|uniref:hypothetical protein n=1 Tax=unclassified Streptomyces TaxID=2593676 RepID=UPI0037BA8234